MDNTYCLHAFNINLHVYIQKGINWPVLQSDTPWTVTKTIVCNEHVQEKLLEFTILPDQEILEIEVTNKFLNDVNQKIEIKKIWSNNILLDTNKIDDCFTFVPSYSLKDLAYAKVNKIELPKIFERSDNNFYYSGKWIFNFKQPFFIWYFKQINMKLEKNSTLHQKKDLLGQLSDKELSRIKFLFKEFST